MLKYFDVWEKLLEKAAAIDLWNVSKLQKQYLLQY